MNKSCQLLAHNEIVRELPLSPDGRFYFKYYGQGGHDKTFAMFPFRMCLREEFLRDILKTALF